MPSKHKPFNPLFLRKSICYVNYFLHSCVTANTIKNSSVTHTSTHKNVLYPFAVNLYKWQVWLLPLQFTYSKMPYKWNHLNSLLSLASFSVMHLRFIHVSVICYFYCWVMVYYMAIPQIFSYATNIQNSFCFYVCKVHFHFTLVNIYK